MSDACDDDETLTWTTLGIYDNAIILRQSTPPTTTTRPSVDIGESLRVPLARLERIVNAVRENTEKNITAILAALREEVEASGIEPGDLEDFKREAVQNLTDLITLNEAQEFFGRHASRLTHCHRHLVSTNSYTPPGDTEVHRELHH